MASAIYRYMVILTLTKISFYSVDGNYNKYISLVSDVRETYNKSTVFFIHSRNDSHMQTYTMAHSLSRTLSNRGVFTLIVNTNDMETRMNYYRSRMSRALAMVLLTSMDEMIEFDRHIRKIDNSHTIWLTIFHGSSSNSMCDYCRRPMGNIFGLRFDTLMLVVCCDDTNLQEWRSNDENRTEIDHIGRWNVNRRLELSLSIEESTVRRNNVRGTTLRVALVRESPLVIDRGDHHIGGLYGMVLRELERSMNFTTSKFVRIDGYGSYNSHTKNWSGAVGALARGEADLALADLTMSESRLDAIDFTYPLLLARSKLYIKLPDGIGMNWFAYFKVFSSKIWMIIGALIITTPLLLTIIKLQLGAELTSSLYFEYCLCVWGIFCQQGLFRFPKEETMRITYYSIYISSVIVYAAYSATLISYLTVSPTSLPFSNLMGFVNDGSYKIIVYQNGSDYDFLHSKSVPQIFEGLRMLMKPWKDLPADPKVAWDEVCKGGVALFTSTVQRKTSKVNCNVVGIDTGRVVSLAIGLPADSQYNQVLNYHIARLKDSGLLNRLKRQYYNAETSSGITSLDNVDLSRIAPILSILAGGIVVALVVLLCETTYYFQKNRRVRNPHRIKPAKKRTCKVLDFGGKKWWPTKYHRLLPSIRKKKIEATFIGYYP